MKKSLCILTDIFITGGVESVILQTFPVLCEKYDVTLFVLTGTIDKELINRMPTEVKIKKGSFHWSLINELKIQLPFIAGHYFKKEIGKSYDILIVLKPSCRGAVAAKLADINVYWNHSSHDIIYEDTRQLDLLHIINRLRLKTIYKQFDEIWQISEALKEKYERIFGIKNCYTINNPIDEVRILKQAAINPEDCSFSEKVVSIVMVGRLSKEKGFERVLHAIGSIQPQISFQVIIIGEGPQEARLRDLSKQYQLDDHVKFLGRKNNPYPYIRCSDLLICPSLQESFGLVILEAMLLRTPVIATRTIGSEYITENGKYGILIDNEDQSIKEVLDRVFHMKLQMNNLLNDAYLRSLEFSVNRFKNRILQRLEYLCEKNS